MELLYYKGQKLAVELTNGQTFTGYCEKCTKSRLDMINVIDVNGVKQKGLLSYYSSEIGSVSLEEEPPVEIIKPELNLEQQCNKIVAIQQDEYEHFHKMTSTFIYLKTINEQYFESVDVLSNCENIGMAMIGNEINAMKSIGLLLLSTWNQVYIFDLLGKNNFPTELKTILESNKIKKVVHNSKVLVNYLWHVYEVKLKNIFDTCVADLMLQKEATGCEPDQARSLSECLVHYFSFPPTCLDEIMETTVEEWKTRPLQESRKTKASQMVTYIIFLKNKQTQLMLKEFHNNVKVFSQLSLNVDSYMAQLNLHSGNVVPKELQEFLNNLR